MIPIRIPLKADEMFVTKKLVVFIFSEAGYVTTFVEWHYLVYVIFFVETEFYPF